MLCRLLMRVGFACLPCLVIPVTAWLLLLARLPGRDPLSHYWKLHSPAPPPAPPSATPPATPPAPPSPQFVELSNSSTWLYAVGHVAEPDNCTVVTAFAVSSQNLADTACAAASWAGVGSGTGRGRGAGRGAGRLDGRLCRQL